MANTLIINISASIMILITFFIRKFVKGCIPHIVFVLLWFAIGVRLLVPIAIDSPSSIYNFKSSLQHKIYTEIAQSDDYEEISQTVTKVEIPFMALIEKINWKKVWLGGCLLFGIYFSIQYINTKKEIDNALTFSEENWISDLIKKQHIPFRVECKISEEISSPAVWGSFKPVILFPSNFDFSDKHNVELIILHECGHIRYFHFMIKMISILIVTLYWYNPFVWILYLYIDRDMEISSDRYVMKQMPGDQRTNYARSLIKAISSKKQTPIFYYHYKKNYAKERIEAIMNFKKLTVGAIITALLIPTSIVSVFATTDITLSNGDLSTMHVKVVDVSYGNMLIEENISLELNWEDIEEYTSIGNERAASYYNVIDYKYVIYGKIPPTSIYVTIDKSGKTYAGTISRTKYVCDDKTDKYIGYYSGKVYLQ